MGLGHAWLQHGRFLEGVSGISETAHAEVCKTQPVLRFGVGGLEFYRVFKSFYGFAIFVLSEKIAPGKEQSVCVSTRVIGVLFNRGFNGFYGHKSRWRFGVDVHG